MAPTKELSVETMECIEKLIQECYPQWRIAKDIGCSETAVSKILGISLKSI